jgi:hypothetical protein
MSGAPPPPRRSPAMRCSLADRARRLVLTTRARCNPSGTPWSGAFSLITALGAAPATGGNRFRTAPSKGEAVTRAPKRG